MRLSDSDLKHQASSIKHQASSIKHQASSIKHQASSISSVPGSFKDHTSLRAGNVPLVSAGWDIRSCTS
jgi:hypothetical protein